MFGSFPENGQLDSDKGFAQNWNEQFAHEFLSKEDIYASLKAKGIGNVDLIEGDIRITLDKYIQGNPYTRIAFLHIDTDIYEPAKEGLKKLYDMVVRGGVIVLDDYATIEGETLAVDEFFSDKDIIIRKFSFSHCKPSYIIKK